MLPRAFVIACSGGGSGGARRQPTSKRFLSLSRRIKYWRQKYFCVSMEWRTRHGRCMDVRKMAWKLVCYINMSGWVHILNCSTISTSGSVLVLISRYMIDHLATLTETIVKSKNTCSSGSNVPLCSKACYLSITRVPEHSHNLKPIADAVAF